ncbi:MAG: deoxyribodipyrimidine photo-lyase [Thermodesulfovibrionales bacterium]|nr:deoxyribodipyrimidine photo-lyase [Thermodesulfovibrionales bacterium]
MRIISIFSRDFRLKDNPLFDDWHDSEIIPVFLIDSFNQKEHGNNLKTLFFEYVKDLQKRLNAINSHLYIVQFDDFESFLVKSHADVVRYTFDGEPNTQKRGNIIEKVCIKSGVRFQPLWNFLIKPHRENFRERFTDFYKSVFIPHTQSEGLTILKPPQMLKTPQLSHKDSDIPSYNKQDHILKRWYKDEEDVLDSFRRFLTDKLSEYQAKRDFPSKDATSTLSPYIRCGVISPKTVYLMSKEHPNAEVFIREVAWAEYFRIWLYNFPFVIDE